MEAILISRYFTRHLADPRAVPNGDRGYDDERGVTVQALESDPAVISFPASAGQAPTQRRVATPGTFVAGGCIHRDGLAAGFREWYAVRAPRACARRSRPAPRLEGSLISPGPESGVSTASQTRPFASARRRKGGPGTSRAPCRAGFASLVREVRANLLAGVTLRGRHRTSGPNCFRTPTACRRPSR
jgi:hypothetical protein